MSFIRDDLRQGCDSVLPPPRAFILHFPAQLSVVPLCFVIFSALKISIPKLPSTHMDAFSHTSQYSPRDGDVAWI